MKVCWHGCSATIGAGFPEDQRDQFVYDRLVCKKLGFDSDNLAEPGASNVNIFRAACASVMSGCYNCVFVQWSELNRLWFYPGPDTEFLASGDSDVHYQYRDILISLKQRHQLRDQVLLLNHDYHNLLALIDFCNILEALANHCQCQLVYINGHIRWKPDLTQIIQIDNLDDTLSDYTKTVLDFDHRNDDELMSFFSRLQNKFASLNRDLWVNLFDPLIEIKLDEGPLGHHYGVKSYAILADLIESHITTRDIIK